MRKDRITIALKKEGIDDVRFYNAGGSLGLNKPNSYFQGKEVTLNNLKQYELVPHHTLDVEKQAAPKKRVVIKTSKPSRMTTADTPSSSSRRTNLLSLYILPKST